MDQARLIIAIGLSFLVFFIWDAFFVEKKPIEPPATEQTEPTPDQAPSESIVKKPAPPVPAAADPEKAIQPAMPAAPRVQTTAARDILVTTDKYEARISEQGAAITSFRLKDHQDRVGEKGNMLELVPAVIKEGTTRLHFEDSRLGGVHKALFSTGNQPSNLIVDSEKQSLALAWNGTDGVDVVKTYTFYKSTYLIDLEIAIINNTTGTLVEQPAIELIGPRPQKTSYAFEGPSAYINNELEQIKIKSIEEKDKYDGRIQWIALQDRYFLTSLVTDPQNEAQLILGATKEVLKNKYVHPPIKIEPGQQVVLQHQLFMGPKQMDLLNAAGKGLGKLLDFGWFDFLARPCLHFLNMIYGVIPNYGLAIIILTIIIKILLWPLGTKSYKSMNEMKRIQPLMAEIREKYKNDKKKQNEEVMNLYRTYKVNPMGGCLPMVLQIPVFFALYRMLYEAIELRHAPFIGWINDLSAPDRLFNFGFSVPLMEPPYGIPVLTLIMGASMFLQQKMSPPMGDPAQAKMMMAMPIIFTFIFINFSSGLVLYWLVNNVLSIAQQYYIQKKFA